MKINAPQPRSSHALGRDKHNPVMASNSSLVSYFSREAGPYQSKQGIAITEGNAIILVTQLQKVMLFFAISDRQICPYISIDIFWLHEIHWDSMLHVFFF